MKQWRWRWQKFLMLAIAIFYLVFLVRITALSLPDLPEYTSNLPAARVHPLPQSLANWQARKGNYFRQIEPSALGYLVWSQFPITVYIQRPIKVTNSAANKRFQQWVAAVERVVDEWNAYLPLQIISDSEAANIAIWRSQPRREAKLNPNTGTYDIPRAVTAETTYKFYLQKNPAVIAHKMTIHISPNFVGIPLIATIRHELGHALGIWGHSLNKQDALYFSQVSNPSPISARDINTLKKIYQQPTRLGWKI